MSFDASLPFVRQVYDLVARDDLDECATWLANFIRARPTTRLHCVLDHSFDHFLPDYSGWLFGACSKHAKLDSSVAIGTTMGEFEINYRDWTAEAIAYDNYRESGEPYRWLCESEGRPLSDWFQFTGLDELLGAFAHADDYDELDPDAKPPYESDIYTAACYLVFTYFLQLNRQTHELASKVGHGFARAHLFCHYGDCLYHSPPLADTA